MMSNMLCFIWKQRLGKIIYCCLLCLFCQDLLAQSIDADSLMNYWLNLYHPENCSEYWIEEPDFISELLAKANPDEGYNGIGNSFISDPFSTEGNPKVNAAYIWGMTKSGDHLWFGTMSNMLCNVLWVMGEEFNRAPDPYETPSMVCEFSQSQYPTGYGDWRPAYIFLYDTQTQTLIDKTPSDPLFQSLSGIRSAGCLGDVVFLAGPSIDDEIILFAFNTTTEAFIGSKIYAEYANVRPWLVVNDVLYTSVLNKDGGGSILRWIGNSTDPFQFDVVGNMDNEGAFLVFHEGRIFATTWPALELSINSLAPAGLIMSPVMPAGGLTQSHANLWELVWEFTDYEPDLVTALTYAGGALASYGGYLYWGSMHVPFASIIAHLFYNEQSDSLATFLGSYRPLSIFRGRNFSSDGGDIELLYGLSQMPKYTLKIPFLPIFGGKWEMVPNRMGVEPLYGTAGFCNFYNNYTWTMAEFKGQLLIGTMDWSYMFAEAMPQLLEAFQIPLSTSGVELPQYHRGADLYRFPGSDSRAFSENLSGIGNYSSYGIRNMISDDVLYLGMANPMNLLTSLNDTIPEGGWELIQLSEIGSGLSQDNALPNRFLLFQNYPNPFNPETEIRFELPEATHVVVRIFNIRGREIRRLVDATYGAGYHSLLWEGMDNQGNPVSSGVYLYQLKTADFSQVKKMGLLR
jgi:hypothetical protein